MKPRRLRLGLTDAERREMDAWRRHRNRLYALAVFLILFGLVMGAE